MAMVSDPPTKKTVVQYRQVGIESAWGHLLPLVMTGVLLWLSFPLPGLWWLAYVALVPVGVLTVRSHRSGRLASCAYLVFLAWWLWQVRWLMPVGLPSWLGCSAVLAGYFTAAVMGLHAISRRWNVPLTPSLPLVWVSMDLLRAHFPAGGFGWFALGQTQGAYLPWQSAGQIAQVADVFGEQTVGIVVAMTSGMVVDLMTRPLLGKAWSAGKVKTLIRRSAGSPVLVWLVVMIAALSYGQWRLMQFEAVTSPGPRISVIQSNLPQSNQAPVSGKQLAKHWQFLKQASLEAAKQKPKPDLIVWPESMAPAALNKQAVIRHPEPWWDPWVYQRQIAQLVRQAKVDFLVGAPAMSDWKRRKKNGQTFEVPQDKRNSAYHFGPDGNRASKRYDKMHLVPFGEYIPGGRWLPWLKEAVLGLFSPWDYDYTLTPGDEPVLFEIPYEGQYARKPRKVNVVTPICFEDTVGRVCRRMVYEDGHKRGDVLVNLTNDGWFAGTARGAQGYQHLQIATFRSIENRVPTARSVNTGISGFIDSLGRIGPLVRTNANRQNVTGSVTDQVRLDRRTTPYAHIGEWPLWLLPLTTLFLLVYPPRA